MKKDNVPNLVKELMKLENKYQVTLITNDFYHNVKLQIDGNSIPEFNVSTITPCMKAYIADLEVSTGIKFSGNNAQDASKYIESTKNIITIKQKEYIHKICSTLGIICKAQTKEQATQFISHYKPAFNMVRNLTR